MLEKRYGRRKTYNAEQIRKSSEDGRLPPAYICYGFALFLDRADFDRVQKERGEVCDYDAMRQDIGNTCFAGDEAFSTEDALTYGETHTSGSDFTDSDFDAATDVGGD